MTFSDLVAKVFKDSHTGIDGDSYDWGRLWGSVALAVFNGLQAWSVIVLRVPFDPISYGTGIGGILAATGAALLMKAKTEPGQTP